MVKTISRRLMIAFVCVSALLGGIGCNNIALPPVLVDLPLGGSLSIPGSSNTSLVGVFCNLLTEAQLDQLLIDAGLQTVADLVDLDRVVLDELEFTAAVGAGDFSGFTRADFSIIVGVETIVVGSVINPAGLGNSFTIVPNNEIDLLTILEDGACGGGRLVLTGTAPATALNYSLTAHLAVYTRLNL
ncbi:MAG: hypothetical protein HYV27_24270 [Candidatus Hydrogenedentes bacterium]|nr:hypothetical protein [Candidatus Hydrogenedentota bacterium]